MGHKLSRYTHYMWRHRYLWAIVLFVAIVGFIDTNSFWHRYELHQANEELRTEIRKYDEKYLMDTRELRELETNPEAVEKVARVRLFMKTANEDVYVLE